MLRMISLFMVLLCALSLSGCGKSNDAIAQEMVDAFNGLATAAESGDKNKIQAAVAKLTSFAREYKDKKISESEKKRLEPKMQEATKRLQASLTKAVASGKMTQQELMALAQTMMTLK